MLLFNALTAVVLGDFPVHIRGNFHHGQTSEVTTGGVTELLDGLHKSRVRAHEIAVGPVRVVVPVLDVWIYRNGAVVVGDFLVADDGAILVDTARDVVEPGVEPDAPDFGVAHDG